MVIAQLSFYEELIHIDVSKSFKQFQLDLSKIYSLDLTDIEELVIYYLQNEQKYFITNENEFNNFYLSLENFNKLNKNSLFTVYFEVNEQSKLYKKEVESSKMFTNSSVVLIEKENSEVENERQRLLKEIQEKEEQLKQTLEKERLEKEKKEQEEKERKLRVEEIKHKEKKALKQIKKDKKLKEKLLKAELELSNKKKEKLGNFLKQKQEKKQRKLSEESEQREEMNKILDNLAKQEKKLKEQKLEEEAKLSLKRLEEIEIQKINEQEQETQKLILKEKEREEIIKEIRKTCTETVNKNIEKLKEEIISKSIEQTISKLDNDNNIKNDVIDSKVVHIGFSCNECNVYPIVGTRYKCTVCFDYDMCEQCESKLGDKHGHSLIKHRQPIIRNTNFRGCPYYRRRNFDNNKENNLFNEIGGKIKNFFVDCKNKVEEIKNNNLSNCNKKEEQVVVNIEIETEQEKKIKEVKSLFIFGDLTDKEVEEALNQNNQNVNATVEYLATAYWDKKN